MIISINQGVTRMPEWRMAQPVDFSLLDGEHIAIVGGNASGKSMFVDIITSAHPLLMKDVEYDFSPKTSRLASDNIKYITFRDSYGGDSDRNYYLQQRWNQHDIDENTPTVEKLLDETYHITGPDTEERRAMKEHLYDIFNSSDPHAEFLDLIAERYADADYEAQDHISSVVRKKIGRRGGAFAADNEGFFISDETEILYQDLFDSGIFRCSLPYSHYYKQRVRLNIMIDTGDGARDYTDNSVYPHWDAAPGIEISSNASILWLAESQGISKTELLKSLTAYTDGLDKTGFLETLAQELINMPSHMSQISCFKAVSGESAIRSGLVRTLSQVYTIRGAVEAVYFLLNWRMMSKYL